MSQDFEEDLKQNRNNEKKYTLEDGRTVSVDDERFRVPECLFQPGHLEQDTPGIHDQIHNSIMNADMETRKDLWGNIVLAGGNTMFQGIKDRLKAEIKALAPSTADPNVVAPPERKYSAWIGGSIISSLSSFQHLWIKKSEFTEIGSSIVHRKCF